jgi:hypothetical protein
VAAARGNVTALITAAHHMNKALKGMPSGPALPQPLGEQVEDLRHLFEHRWEAQGDLDNGIWGRLGIRHGAVYLTPWSVESNGSDLKIGAMSEDCVQPGNIGEGKISVQAMEQEPTRVLDELLHIDTEELEQVDS